ERFTEETGRDDCRIGAADPLEDEVAEAAAHRVADEQRAGQHGDRRRDAEHDGRVGAPVIEDPAANEIARPHTLTRSPRNTRNQPFLFVSFVFSCLSWPAWR